MFKPKSTTVYYTIYANIAIVAVPFLFSYTLKMVIHHPHTEIKEFKDNIHTVIQRNCFENIIQNPNDLVSVVVKGDYKYYPQREISCEVVTAFEKWYDTLSDDWQRLVLNNIIAKLSVVKIE